MPRTKTAARMEDALNELFGDHRPTRWVTRERPKIDRIACPWAIRRFIDPDAVVLYVPTSDVLDVAKREGAAAFDIPGAPITHEGELCSFDKLIQRFGLEKNKALATVARIVRGADTNRHKLAAEAAGLHAISLGLSKLHADDHAMLAHGMIVYDALYAWAGGARDEVLDWRPQ
jgi:hypothetical protein